MTTDLLEAPGSSFAHTDTPPPPSPQTSGDSPLTPPPQPDTQTTSELSPDTAPTPEHPEDEDSDGDEPTTTIAARLESDALEFTKATISLHLQLLPHDQHPDGRPILIGIHSHQLTPLLVTVREHAIMPHLPQPILDHIEKWKAHYSQAIEQRTATRKAQKAKDQAKRAKDEADRKRRQDEQKLKAKSTKPKPPVTQVKPTATINSDHVTTQPSTPPAQDQPQSTLF